MDEDEPALKAFERLTLFRTQGAAVLRKNQLVDTFSATDLNVWKLSSFVHDLFRGYHCNPLAH